MSLSTLEDHLHLSLSLFNLILMFLILFVLVSGGADRVQQRWRGVWSAGWEEVCFSGRRGGSGQHHEQCQESKGQILIRVTLSAFTQVLHQSRVSSLCTLTFFPYFKLPLHYNSEANIKLFTRLLLFDNFSYLLLCCFSLIMFILTYKIL